MELYFLEDDECNELFITQTPSESFISDMECTQSPSVSSIFGCDGHDFSTPCFSIVDKNKPIYEDISEDKFQQPVNGNAPNCK